MRSKWVRGLALGAAAAVAAACAPSSSSTPDAGGDRKPVELSVWGWRQEDTAAYARIFKVFEDKNPRITVKYVPYKATEYDTILKTGLAGTKGPDVAQLRSYGLVQPLIQAGNLVPLDDKVPALADFPASVLDGARGKRDKVIYGVPFAIQTLHVIYDKAAFAKHDISVPTTWSDLMALCQKLQSAGVIPFAATVKDTWMLPVGHEIFGASRYGGEDFRKKGRVRRGEVHPPGLGRLGRHLGRHPPVLAAESDRSRLRRCQGAVLVGQGGNVPRWHLGDRRGSSRSTRMPNWASSTCRRPPDRWCGRR